mmetsp:Transcript_71460/g.149351  ORF Transcript_71460/g.149351 Transcript_71460/m.149351 type:complete len:1062 (+) Transcript_71460:191-3376(+)|eukprot:CAMPEP_0206565268 /NCGR_PEP_ID=MMETSP0325_2-20121206/23977_1 /ASSEMBLY_ACC=CAM_ASM_000347 /TAXON_ID=2866 /ORGANISM="Crypthecodinium cohnii, Strain Seligo" /LENGTH=1061 /DNA_ID=CAMNT_0054068105 /DNA_START=57 /DNA_END=3242 /DNA_ORIENTATION=-
MAVAKRERVHHQGHSNRVKDLGARHVAQSHQPINFDSSVRAVNSRKMAHSLDTFVPFNSLVGEGNRDFGQRLPGHDYRQPNSDLREQRTLRQALELSISDSIARQAGMPDEKISAPNSKMRSDSLDKTAPRQKPQKAAPRWNPSKWFADPAEERAPLQKDEGEPWNHLESENVQGDIKGQDRLMRTVRCPEEVGSPKSDRLGKANTITTDSEEYYPGRSTIDSQVQDRTEDLAVRPVHLPDFHNPPPVNDDGHLRMQRLRSVMRQRFAGRTGLVGFFRTCAQSKPGFVFSRDLQMIFDSIGIKVDEPECRLLIQAVDRDQKGAITYQEFLDMIYEPEIEVGGPPHLALERHAHRVTTTLVERLITNGQALGKAFCEIDPERRYLISKAQFGNALSTACNHISKQAVEYLWASQFQSEGSSAATADIENRHVDWRSFMSQLALYAHENRPPTPCTLQGRKRQYDLLQRAAPVRGDQLVDDSDLDRPEQETEDKVVLVAGKLCLRSDDLRALPRDVAIWSDPFIEELHAKARRCELTLPFRVPKARMKELLKNRKMVPQDDLAALIWSEVEGSAPPAPLPAKEPLYGTTTQNSQVMTLDRHDVARQQSHDMTIKDFDDNDDEADAQAQVEPKASQHRRTPMVDDLPRPIALQLRQADIKAYLSRQRTNKEDEIDVDLFLESLYMPEDERKVAHTVKDGLNKHLRGLRPPRERPPDDEVPRHTNYWQARYMMDALADSLAQTENVNGGRLKPSRIFKRLDIDQDGYVCLTDLKNAFEKYKVPHNSADLHALFTHLDKADNGSIDVGEFTRNFEEFQGNLLDAMSRPIKAVHPEGGVQYSGPAQDVADARERQLAAEHIAGGRAASAPAGALSGRSATPLETVPPLVTAIEAPRSASAAGGSMSSRSSMTSRNLPGIGRNRQGPMRVTDVIRSRCNQWKAQPSERYNTVQKTRFGMTVHPDTRHITEPSVPLAASHLPEAERFKTTNNCHSAFSTPEPGIPQTLDALKKHARNEFRVERIRQRQRDISSKCWAANEAVEDFDKKKIARKALAQLNYERRVRMHCT